MAKEITPHHRLIIVVSPHIRDVETPTDNTPVIIPINWLDNLTPTQRILVQGAMRNGGSTYEALVAGLKAGEHSKDGVLYNSE